MVTKKSISNEQATVKVRIIDFELSGSDDSLRESLQTLAAAFNRNGQSVQVARQLPVRPHLTQNTQIGDIEGENEVDDESQQEVEDVQPKVSRAASPRKPPKPPVVKVLNNISFSTASPTLKEFYEAKAPGKNITANYLVVAYWFKHHGGIEELTVDHFHTAFRHVGFATPKNALQPIRDLRNNRDGRFMSGATPNSCIINHLGENYVDALNKVE